MSSWLHILSHRSIVYSGGCAILWLHGSTVYDWWPCPLFLMSSVYDMSMECLPQELGYMIFCWCLDVCRFSIRCALGSWHTHATYKVYRLSLVPLLEFGGHSVIQKFGHCDDVMMMKNQALYQRILSWENLQLSSSTNHILKHVRRIP